MYLSIEPITVKAARKLVKSWHRHLPDVQGGLFAAACAIDGAIVGVSIAGNPPRVWQGTGRIVISRVATDETRNACSKLYGAMCRAAQALGYREVWTYSLPEESGESLRGAGFEEMGVSRGGEHDRPSRRRAKSVRPEPKKRWRRIIRTEQPATGETDMKKKTKTTPKRATRPMAPSAKKNSAGTPKPATTMPVGHLNAESRPQIAPGAPVFVRVEPGDYQLGVLMRNASKVHPGPGQLCVRLAERNPFRMYDVAKFGPELAVNADRISRVFMERDWESIAAIAPESGNQCDERIARGPSHDELQRDPTQPPVHMVICDEEDAAELAAAIIAGAVPTRGTLCDLARWTMHAIDLLGQWKDKLDKIDEADDLHQANVLATQAKGPPKKGSIIDLWLGKGKTESVKVTLVDANEIHFVGVDGNGGSRPLADEGDAWLVNVNLDEKTFDARAANWARMNPPRKVDGIPASQPELEAATSTRDVASPATVPSSKRKDLPKAGDFIDVDGIGVCVVDTCARGYITFRAMTGGAKGRRRTSDADWARTSTPLDPSAQIEKEAQDRNWNKQHEARTPKPELVEIPAIGSKISVRTGGSWETVTVMGGDPVSRIVSFAADDGVGGTLRMSQLDVGWRMLSNAETARLAKTPAALAQSAENERKDVERTGNKAARKAAGTKTSPIDRAVADAAKTGGMVVTSERLGPPIEQSFVDDAKTPTMSLHKRNIAASKRLGITLDEVMRRRDAGTLDLGPEDRQAAIETTQRSERTAAGLDDNGTPTKASFVSMPKVGDAVHIMSVSGWVPTTVEGIRPNGAFPSIAFVVRGGLVLPLAGHGVNWRRALEVESNDEPDDDELSVASDRELLELGKRRASDGAIVDIEIPTPMPVPSAARMPWEE